MADLDRQIDLLIRIQTQVDIPPDVEERMSAKFTRLRATVENEQKPRRARPARWVALAGLAVAACLAFVLFLPTPDGADYYSAAAAQLKRARSVQYTFEFAPYTSIEFSHLAPDYFRAQMSWGIEVRSDGSGNKLVLLHAMHKYALEKASPAEFSQQQSVLSLFKKLPVKPSAAIGERTARSHVLQGYRIDGRSVPGASGLKELRIWVDKASRTPYGAEFVFQEAGKPEYEMRIRDIRVDAALDPAMFSTTPPSGYTRLPMQDGNTIVLPH